MKDGFFYRKLYKTKSDVAQFFKRYSISIILLICFFIVGLVAGIFTASRNSGNLTLSSIPDDNLVSFLQGTKGSFGIFFSYFITLSIAILLIVFCNLNPFCSLINMFYILIRGYILGFTIFSFIALFSFAGIINGIIILPFWLFIDFTIILISAICVAKGRIIKNYGKVCYNDNNPRNFIILLCVILTAILFLMCMLMPIIKITIIVN